MSARIALMDMVRPRGGGGQIRFVSGQDEVPRCIPDAAQATRAQGLGQRLQPVGQNLFLVLNEMPRKGRGDGSIPPGTSPVTLVKGGR